MRRRQSVKISMPVVRAALIAAFVLASLMLGRTATALIVRLGRSADDVPLLFCRAALHLLGIRVEISGAPSAGARLVVANHVSWIDILALGSVEPLSFVAKREVASWPLAGALARRQGTVFVDRGRRRQIPAVNAAMADRLLAGRSVLLFPEGTTYEGSSPGPFKTSHLACLRDVLAREPAAAPMRSATVQPLAITYDEPVAAWIGDATLLPHIWTVLCRPGITCRLSYGKPLRVESGFNRKQLGPELRQAIAAAMLQSQRASPAGLMALTHVHKLVVSDR